MKSRNYSESEKFAAVERFLVGGESVATIAADTGISRSTLYAWIKSAQIEPGMLEFTRKIFGCWKQRSNVWKESWKFYKSQTVPPTHLSMKNSDRVFYYCPLSFLQITLTHSL